MSNILKGSQTVKHCFIYNSWYIKKKEKKKKSSPGYVKRNKAASHFVAWQIMKHTPKHFIQQYLEHNLVKQLQ